MHGILKDKEVIFFDVGHTIDMPASGDWRLTKKFYEIVGNRLDGIPRGLTDEALRIAGDYLAANHLCRSEEEEYERFLEYFRIVSLHLNLGLSEDELHVIAHDHTYNMDNYIIYPDAREVIETLSHSYRLGIISDTWPSIWNQLRSLDVLQFFSFTTFSFELGVYKPDKRMFLDALEKCGCEAEKTVFIDDVPVNLEGAAELCITPVLIAANPASDVETPFLKIRSLSELLTAAD